MKLSQMEELTGMSAEEMAEAATYDSVAEGICMNDGCDYMTTVEPDCFDGYCEVCDTNTVKSVLAIMGII